MAAKETKREFRPDRGAVVVVIQDDFGSSAVHTIHISHDHELCPACGHRLVRDAGGDVDVDAEVKQLLEDADKRVARLLPKLQKAGMKEATA